MNRTILRHLLSVVIVAGLIVALWPLGQTAYSHWSQQRLRVAWDKAAGHPSKPAASHRAAAKRKAPRAPWPATRIVIPAAGVDAVVLDGWDDATLRQAPGHMKSSALPGERGNCVIAGHRNVYGSPFANVDQLNPGALIELHTPAGVLNYSVLRVFVAMETDQTVLRAPEDPNAVPRLTLVTCTVPRTSSRVLVEAYLNDY